MPLPARNCLSTLRIPATLLLLALPVAAAASDIRPFESDGCSAFPDGTLLQNELWLGCCIEHDRAYWQGGTREQRRAADAALQDCVAGVGEPALARLMLAGVRVGGSPYWPTQFRWGYGWPWPRGYKALTDTELEQVRAAAAGIAPP